MNRALPTEEIISRLRGIAAGILNTADFLEQGEISTLQANDKEDNCDRIIHELNICIANQPEGRRLQIADLCKGMGMSRTSLYRHLQDALPIAPAHYVLLLRLIQAGVLLESGQYSVGEVAFKTGFRDESHFIKVFKKHFGQTPTLWRERIKK